MTLITKHALRPLWSLIGPLIGPDLVLHIERMRGQVLLLIEKRGKDRKGKERKGEDDAQISLLILAISSPE